MAHRVRHVQKEIIVMAVRGHITVVHRDCRLVQYMGQDIHQMEVLLQSQMHFVTC